MKLASSLAEPYVTRPGISLKMTTGLVVFPDRREEQAPKKWFADRLILKMRRIIF